MTLILSASRIDAGIDAKTSKYRTSIAPYRLSTRDFGGLAAAAVRASTPKPPSIARCLVSYRLSTRYFRPIDSYRPAFSSYRFIESAEGGTPPSIVDLSLPKEPPSIGPFEWLPTGVGCPSRGPGHAKSPDSSVPSQPRFRRGYKYLPRSRYYKANRP